MRHAIWLSDSEPSLASNFGPVTVPADQYLLVGDDRDNSMDSRHVGCFPRNKVLGRARDAMSLLVQDHHCLPRTDRFGVLLE